MSRAVPHTPLPGDLAIWFFIYAELLVFGILFIAYAITKNLNPEIFAEGHAHLNRLAGLINTGALITSSYFVVRAVGAIKLNRRKACGTQILLALAAASIYVLVKLFEYYQSISVGFDLSTNTFYTFYYLLTFFHFAHVLLGMVILAAIYFKNRTGHYSNIEHTGVETGASYWHMVDLVWVILFPLVYVIR